MALDSSEFELPPEEDSSEEKTAAFDPASMGLLDDSPEEVEEKTAAFDPESLGLLDDAAPAQAQEPAEERTAAFDPGMLEAPAREAAPVPPPTSAPPSKEKTDAFHPSRLSGETKSPVPEEEERTVAMDIPPDFFDDEPAPQPPSAPPVSAPPAPAAPPVTATSARPTASPPAPRMAPSTAPPDTRSAASAAARASARVAPVTGRMEPPSLVSANTARPEGSKTSIPLPALIGGGVALLAIIGGLFMMDFSDSESSPDASEAQSAVDSDEDEDSSSTLEMELPASANMIVSVKLSRLWKSWLFEAFEDAVIAQLEGERDYVTFEERTGIKLTHLKRLDVALDPSADDFAPIALMDLKRLKPKKLESFLADEFRATSTDIEGVTFYQEDKRAPLIGVIGPKRVALGSKEELQAALDGPSWKKNKTLKRAFGLLRSKAALRAVIPVEGAISEELPLDALPMGKAVKTGDLIAVSFDADDAVVLEFAYIATGENADERLDTVHKELKATLEMAKAEREALVEEARGELPPAALKAATNALDGIKLKRKDDGVTLKLKLPREDLEPLVEMAKEMLPPAPPKAKPRTKRKKAETAEDGDEDTGSVDAGALPQSCKRLVTCCDELVKTTPAAKASCDAQRQAFKQVSSAPASAKQAITKALTDGCRATLDGFSAFPDAPAVCSTK